MSSGREALARWLGRRARTSATRFVALEEALLAGRFVQYATRRLAAFGLARAVATVVHLVELTWLFEIFSAKPFVASIALQNVTLVADAFFWGALERFRRRARELGPTSEAAALASRWLTVAAWLALGAIALPIAVALRSKDEPMLHAYAIVCGARFGADVLVRTYYSGVFAYRRVYRPVWSVVLGPAIVIAVTLLLWERAGGWSFVAALAVSVAVSRGLLLVYTGRAYRRFRVPRPTLRLLGKQALAVIDRGALLAGVANLSTRIGGVVLLAALVPSLTEVVGPDDEPLIEPYAFALHLAAPFILVASQWALVFYHDWKRLEDEGSAHLAHLFARRLHVTAVLVGVGCAACSAGLVLLYVPWQEAWPTLVALLGATTGLAIWTALQLRQFSHGEHARQVASAIALVAVVALALGAEVIDVPIFHPALALGPWVAIATHAMLARRRARTTHGELRSVAAFADALRHAGAGVIVWEAVVATRPSAVVVRIAERLGTRGAIVRVGPRLLWFERGPASPRGAWLAAASGLLRSLERVDVAGVLAAPEPTMEVEALAREHARVFADGFVLRVGGPAPPPFLALAPRVRQAIWRDALRDRAGARGRSGWFVTCLARDGGPDTVFVAPRPVSADRASAWRRLLRTAEWRLGSRPDAAAERVRTERRRAA